VKWTTNAWNQWTYCSSVIPRTHSLRVKKPICSARIRHAKLNMATFTRHNSIYQHNSYMHLFVLTYLVLFIIWNTAYLIFYCELVAETHAGRSQQTLYPHHTECWACDHTAGKASTISQLTWPTQPASPPGSVKLAVTIAIRCLGHEANGRWCGEMCGYHPRHRVLQTLGCSEGSKLAQGWGTKHAEL